MNIPKAATKIVELRNEKEIARAVMYAENAFMDCQGTDKDSSPECEAIMSVLIGLINALKLGRPNEDINQSVVLLVDRIRGIVQSSIELVEGANVQMAEFAEELEALEASQASHQSAVSLKEIDEELERRQAEREQASTIQEQFENERDELIPKIRTYKAVSRHTTFRIADDAKQDVAKMEARLKELEKTIESLVNSIAKNDEEVTQLTSYRTAVALVNQGLSPDLFPKKKKL